jgi:ABC-type transport system involved in multi-copper enzyme maturation permease subunit
MALTAFVSAWSFLLTLEIFTSLQVKFAGMSDAPTIIQGIVYPVIAAQAKLSILIVSIIAGLSFSRLNNNNGWFLINSQQLSEWNVITQKFLAILLISLMFMLPSMLAILVLTIMAELNTLPFVLASCGLLLLLIWMLALSMYVSSLVNNTGFAMLLSIVILLMLWLLAQSSVGAEWGKNWLQALSPQYHFQQFSSVYLSSASLLYFLVGTVLALWATQIRLIHRRRLLL